MVFSKQGNTNSVIQIRSDVDNLESRVSVIEGGGGPEEKEFLATDGSNSPSSDISWSDNKITSLKDATDPKDAANLDNIKNYVSTFKGKSIYTIDSGDLGGITIASGEQLDMLSDILFVNSPSVGPSLSTSITEYLDENDIIITDVVNSTRLKVGNPFNSSNGVYNNAYANVVFFLSGTYTGFAGSTKIRVGYASIDSPGNTFWDGVGFPIFSDGDFDNERISLGGGITKNSFFCNGSGAGIFLQNSGGGGVVTINSVLAIITYEI